MTTIPPFDRLNKANLIALDVADQLNTIGVLTYQASRISAPKHLVVKHIGELYVFGYESDATGAKDYFYRRLQENDENVYFVYAGMEIELPMIWVRKAWEDL